jgi:hypothetical protein
MKRNHAFIAFFVAISLPASPARAQQEIPRYSFSAHPSQDGRCRGDNGHGDVDRSEKACLAELTGIAMREEDALRLSFRNGSSKTYVNRPKECEHGAEGCIEYKLVGYFPKHELVLIEVGYSEGAEWMLVRLDSGKETKIVVPPHYSPREKWLVSVCWSEGPAGCENGIDIVPSRGDQTGGEWHCRVLPTDYTLYEFSGWDGDERVKLAVTFHVGDQLKTFPASVDLVAGRWRLKLPKEHRNVALPKSEKKPTGVCRS